MKSDRRDFLSRFLKLHEEDRENFTMDEVLIHVGTNVYEFQPVRKANMTSGAGSDTTAISLRAMLYNLAKHPSTMRKLQQEIEEMEAKGVISDPVTYQQSCKMPYLQAVMKEAMRFRDSLNLVNIRLHPATGLTLARVVPKGGAFLAGRKFKEGVNTSLSRVTNFRPLLALIVGLHTEIPRSLVPMSTNSSPKDGSWMMNTISAWRDISWLYTFPPVGFRLTCSLDWVPVRVSERILV